MEDPREAVRLRKKKSPLLFINTYLKEPLERIIQKKNNKKVRILDVGCGDGSISSCLANIYPEIEVHGLDINKKRFREEQLKSAPCPNLRFHVVNALRTSFKDCTFDLVFARSFLEYIKDAELAVKEMTRITRFDGSVLLQDLDGQLVTHYPMDVRFSDTCNKVIKYLQQTGFDPFIGRKLFYFARKCSLHHISVRVEPYHLFAGRIDKQNYDLWKMKLDIALPHLISALGSKFKALRFREEYLNYLLDEDSLTFSTVFTVTGTK